MYRFIPPLIVLVPQDLYISLRTSLLTVLRVVYAIVRLSSVKVSQDHGFDPPCGSHQLPVFKVLCTSEVASATRT